MPVFGGGVGSVSKRAVFDTSLSSHALPKGPRSFAKSSGYLLTPLPVIVIVAVIVVGEVEVSDDR
jgi:hypothetical protein